MRGPSSGRLWLMMSLPVNRRPSVLGMLLSTLNMSVLPDARFSARRLLA